MQYLLFIPYGTMHGRASTQPTNQGFFDLARLIGNK
jgi:hypothetical protein